LQNKVSKPEVQWKIKNVLQARIFRIGLLLANKIANIGSDLFKL